jgi:hypothetical protein
MKSSVPDVSLRMPSGGMVSEMPSELVRVASEIGFSDPATCPTMLPTRPVSPVAIVVGSLVRSSELVTVPLAAVTVPRMGRSSPFGFAGVTAVDRSSGMVRSAVKVNARTKRSSLKM